MRLVGARIAREERNHGEMRNIRKGVERKMGHTWLGGRLWLDGSYGWRGLHG
jgi:hypothetical protein